MPIIFVPAFGAGTTKRIMANTLLLKRALELAKVINGVIVTDNHVLQNVQLCNGKIGNVPVYHPTADPIRPHESTRYLALYVKELIAEKGWQDAAMTLLAAPTLHRRRAKWELNDVGLRVDYVDKKLDDRSVEFFCLDSIHWQTKFASFSYAYETLLWWLIAIAPGLYRRLTK